MGVTGHSRGRAETPQGVREAVEPSGLELALQSQTALVWDPGSPACEMVTLSKLLNDSLCASISGNSHNTSPTGVSRGLHELVRVRY